MISTLKSSWRDASIEPWVPLLLAASLFAVPLSSTAKSICIPMAMLAILMAPVYRRELSVIFQQPWCRAALLLFLIACVGCFWSPATLKEKGLILEKYSKLLYLPILVVGFREARARQAGIHAFLAAMALTCVVSFLQVFGIVPHSDINTGMVFRNYIMTGHMMAFAAYLSVWFCMNEQGKQRLLYAFLAVLFSYQVLFISVGRTGYVVYALLMVLLVMQTWAWKKAIFAGFIACSLFVIGYYQNPVMQAGVQRAVHDWQHYHQDDRNTSVGYRLQFHHYAKQLFLKHPLIGNGTASFTHLFAEDKPVPSWKNKLLEPHSLYWLIASEFGLLGLLALAFFFGSLLVASLRLSAMRAPAMALLLPFFVGNVSDSLLFYSGSGYFFILFMALCLGESSYRKG